MIGKHRFFEGERVVLNLRGRSERLVPKTRLMRVGTVQRVSQHNVPVVLWDGQKTAHGYHPDFIEPLTGVDYGDA